MMQMTVQQVVRGVQEGDVAEKLLSAPVLKYSVTKKGIVSTVQ